ncbi:NADH-quinone oxidoreductase subunit J [Picrophilus oshimae]|uniref:NADH-quinone oxidoreductase subunit J n=1 Tax=Picrophilus oshimae TaxID=46632 RepID=UPI002351DA81|nr:NADH-quinone oxidoreductase subunit J [Picrophilus oshimae]
MRTLRNKLQKIAIIVFFIIFAVNFAFIRGSFIIRSQNISRIGTELFSTYIIPFELLSLILVAAIIGVMYIAWEERR